MNFKKTTLYILVLFTRICYSQLTSELTLPYEFFNNSTYTDEQIYVGLVGRFDNKDVWMDMTEGTLHEMSADLNTIDGPEWSAPEDWKYPDIFYTLSEIENNTINLPHGLFGCRIFISFESPMYLHFHDTGGYAGANLNWDADPNNGIRWELVELTWGDSGLWTNTSRVDAYQYPIAVEVNGFQGSVGLDTYAENYERALSGDSDPKYGIIGEKLSHEEIMSRWDEYVDTEYLVCKEIAEHSIDGEPVIHQPSKVESFPDDILDDYIAEIWSVYKHNDLVIDIGDRGIWTGRIDDEDHFNFVDPADGSIATIYGVPTTVDALEGAGYLANSEVSRDVDNDKHNEDLMIQAQISAAITRHAIYTDVVGPTVQYTHDGSRYFLRNPHNQYVSFFHQEEITHNSLTYAFAYDDVGDHSATIQTTFPTEVRVIIGGYDGYVVPDPYLNAITVGPNVDEITIGEQLQFEAIGYDQFSEVFETNVTWSVSGGGSINSTGLFSSTTAGDYTITATDGDISRTVNFTVIEEQPEVLTGCEADSPTGEYSYIVSNGETNNPSITFVPSNSNIGDDVCLLFYGTDPEGVFGARTVEPNTPYQITANIGEIVYFYYTYSREDDSEHNTENSRHSFMVGDCNASLSNHSILKELNNILLYPNPNETDHLTLSGIPTNSTVKIYNANGQLLIVETTHQQTEKSLNTSQLLPGIYLVKIENQTFFSTRKLIIL